MRLATYFETKIPIIGVGIAAVVLSLSLGYMAATFKPTFSLGAVFVVVLVLMFTIWTEGAILGLLTARSGLDQFSDESLAGFGGTGSALNLAAILSVLLIVCGLTYILSRKVTIAEIPVVKPYLAFLFIAMITIAFSPVKISATFYWLRLLSILILYVVMVDVLRSRKQVRRVVLSVLVSSVAPVIVGLWDFRSGLGLTRQGFYATAGTFAHPATFAKYLVIVLILVTVLFFSTPSIRNKAIYGLVAVPIGANLILTYARGPFLGLTVGLLLVGALKFRKLLLAVPILIVVLVVLVPDVGRRFEQVSLSADSQQAIEQNTLIDRFDIWQQGFELWRMQPVFGHGLASNTAQALVVNDQTVQVAHNDFIRLAVETGAVGVAAYLWLLGAVCLSAWRSYRRTADPYLQAMAIGFLGMFVWYVINSASDNVVYALVVQWYFWAFAAVAVAASRIGETCSAARASRLT